MRSRVPTKLLVKAVTRAPDLTSFLLRSLYRKHIGTSKDYRKGDGKALKPPMQISLRITNLCNHRCAVCGQYGKNGYMHFKESSHLLKTLPVEKYKELVDQNAKYKPLYYLTGGETFLYPGLVELCNYMKKKGSVVSLVTNGVLLEKYAEDIVKNQWDMIMVSFDGPKEVHDKCRNFEGAYDTALKGLQKISRIKKRMKSVKPFVLTSTTISPVNAPVLEETFNIGKLIDPDLMVVYLSWFTSQEVGEAQTRILEKNMGVTPYTWKSYVRKFTKADVKMFKKAITKVRKKRWPFEYFIIPDLKEKDIEKYYLDPKDFCGYAKCIAPFIMVDIMPNGDVVTCRDYIDVVVGNITEKPLLQIWNNEKFVKWRRLLIRHNGKLPQCSRCCGLMGF
jgi:radical SAM protein with 4Fe4S-binding SPASM domain